MNEADSSRLDDSLSGPERGALASAGSLLKAARETQGLDIAALAVALKVPVRKLEALEADRFDSLTDIVFVRALAASMCRTLKIDSAQVLSKLPNTVGLHLNPKTPIMSVPFRAPRDRLGSSLTDHLSKPLSLGILLLFLGVLALVFAPLPQLSELHGVSLADLTVEGKSAPIPASAVTKTPMAVSAGSASIAVETETSSARPQIDAGQPSGQAVSVSQALNLTAQAPIVPASSAGEVVVFSARGASWVEVVDATGSVKLRKTLANGDVVGASGFAPLSVVVGRADVVDVQLRGKPFDLVPVAKENVARFEVK